MTNPPPDSAAAPVRIDIGGRRLAATVFGEGAPLVLLESGFGAESGSWAAVARGVARSTRVAFYDRAGRGGSDPAPRPRGPDALLQDARLLARSIAGPGAVVLVGQSFGGLIARLYAHRYPAEVAGVVLVDSLHEDQFEKCAPHFPPPFSGEPAMLMSMRDFWSGGWRHPAQNREEIDMIACQAAAHRVETLGKMPLRVLTAGSFLVPPGFPPQDGRRLQGIWEELQGRLASLSSAATHQVLADSGHFMQIDKPQAVIDAITGLVAEIRATCA